MPPDAIRGSSDIGTVCYPSLDEICSLKRRSIIDEDTAADETVPVNPKAQKIETGEKEATLPEDIKEPGKQTLTLFKL